MTSQSVNQLQKANRIPIKNVSLCLELFHLVPIRGFRSVMFPCYGRETLTDPWYNV